MTFIKHSFAAINCEAAHMYVVQTEQSMLKIGYCTAVKLVMAVGWSKLILFYLYLWSMVNGFRDFNLKLLCKRA